MVNIILIVLGGLTICFVMLIVALSVASTRAEREAMRQWSGEGASQYLMRCYYCSTPLGWRADDGAPQPKLTCPRCLAVLVKQGGEDGRDESRN